ncbi:MAG TPA: nucleotide pyrophosphohydrolase [Cyanobacteria bacterium UBA8530]|nr:nucleotide pyrophosphohydrolase [Cyanobacteria bacterium UBA8530]
MQKIESLTITLPRLDGLSPSLESTTLKLMEEAGELAQAIGKLRGLSGERDVPPESESFERIAQELLDVAQTAVTMMYVLEEQHQVDIHDAIEGHLAKLRRKGYLK